MQETFLLSRLLVISIMLSATLSTQMSVNTTTTPTSPALPSEILQLVFLLQING